MNEGSSPKLRVAIVVPAKKFLCLGGLLWTQRYGALQVASVVRDAGYAVQLFNEELGLRVTAEQLAQSFDVVGFSCKSSALTRAEELAEAIKKKAKERGCRVVTVLGGEHISMAGDSRFSPQFDYLLRGESEEAFVALLKALESAGDREGEEVIQGSLENHHTCRLFDNIPDLSLVVGYAETARGFLFRRLPLLRFPLLLSPSAERQRLPPIHRAACSQTAGTGGCRRPWRRVRPRAPSPPGALVLLLLF